MQLKSRDYIFISLIIIVLSILYFQSLFHQIVFLDDDTLIFTKFSDLSLIDKIHLSFSTNYLGGHYYRPIALLTIILDALIASQSFFVYHLTNIIIHLLTCVIIFLTLKKLGYSLTTSLLASLLFSVNPIHINAVGWIAGRGDLLAALFSVAAFLIFLKFVNQQKVFLLFFVSLMLFIAILSKENSILVPFLIMGFFFIEKKEFKLDKNSAGVLLMIVIVFGSYYLLRGLLLPEVNIDKFSFTTYYRNILVLPETISKFFIPIGIKALPSIEGFTSISGIVILILFFFLPLKVTSINKLRYYFGLIWFIILLLPGMVFRTMGQDGFYYWDCRSYLPAIGLMFIAAEIFRVINLQKFRRLYFSVVLIYLLILAPFTFIKIDLYKNAMTYWNSVKADYPARFLPYIGLYNYYNHYKDLSNAETQLVKAIKLKPNEITTQQLLIDFYLRNEKKEEAYQLVKEILERKLSSTANLFEHYITLSIELNRINDIDKLIALYAEKVETNKDIEQIILNKVESLKSSGEIIKSNLLLEKIQKLDL